MITDGRRNNNIPARYLFLPRKIEHDAIVIENGTGHISLGALRWLSHHNIPIFFLDFDGSVISSILPPTPIKADLRVAQIQASADSARKFTIAHALVEAKIARSLQILDWSAQRHNIKREIRMTKVEALRLGKANTIGKLRTVEGRTALRYWQGFAKIMPEPSRFKGRASDSHNNNASDCYNAALNYGYGYLKILCRTAINSVGLEPAVGFLHELSTTQTAESLVYDLQEPWRWLVDFCVIAAFESQKLSPHDFAWTKDDYLYRLEWEGKMRLLDLLRVRFNSGVNYKGRVLKWDTVIEEKTLELSRFLTGRSSTLDFCEPSPTL
jgi:CRISPR-associated protein Cas1